jgi:hypothetical protein
MATAKEIGLQPGDIAIWATSEIEEVDTTYSGKAYHGIRGGISFDTKDVIIHAASGRVIETESPFHADTSTTVEILWSNSDHYSQGDKINIHSRFRNFIAEGDSRMLEELNKGRLRVTLTIDGEGRNQFVLAKTTEEDFNKKTSMSELVL